MRNLRFLHSVRVREFTADEELDDIFLVGLSSSSSFFPNFKVQSLLKDIDILDGSFIEEGPDASTMREVIDLQHKAIRAGI